jgi:hypothetical protein
MGVAVGWAYAAMELWVTAAGLVGEVTRLGAAILSGVLFLAFGVRILNLPEGRVVFDRLPFGRGSRKRER